ncbi:MAG: HAD family hydrolase [Candidatus Fermentibacteraceae bacterium]|nr:HAD family hydrolase [Candidatus Fermentibacteraceae bacterium]
MKYRAVVFDMDGTLVNTIPDIALAVNSVLRGNGLVEKTVHDIEKGVGYGVDHLLRTHDVPEQMNSSLVREIDNAYSEMKQSKAYVYSGVRNLIQMVSQAGVQMFILSNKLQRSLEKSVSDHLSFAEFLQVVGSGPGSPAKPSPDLLLGILDEFELPLDSVLMVGDGEADVAVAQAAGIPCVSVLWGFRSRKALEAAGADLFASTPLDVAKFILGEEQ